MRKIDTTKKISNCSVMTSSDFVERSLRSDTKSERHETKLRSFLRAAERCVAKFAWPFFIAKQKAPGVLGFGHKRLIEKTGHVAENQLVTFRSSPAGYSGRYIQLAYMVLDILMLIDTRLKMSYLTKFYQASRRGAKCKVSF